MTTTQPAHAPQSHIAPRAASRVSIAARPAEVLVAAVHHALRSYRHARPAVLDPDVAQICSRHAQELAMLWQALCGSHRHGREGGRASSLAERVDFSPLADADILALLIDVEDNVVAAAEAADLGRNSADASRACRRREALRNELRRLQAIPAAQ